MSISTYCIKLSVGYCFQRTLIRLFATNSLFLDLKTISAIISRLTYTNLE